MRRRLVPFLAAAALFPGCLGLTGDGNRVAGNGSEVENAVVSGRVVTAGGAPAPATDVTLYTSAFDAMEGAVDSALTARTDTGGGYTLSAPPGSYSLWGHKPAGGQRFLVQDIEADSGKLVRVATATLLRPGRLRVTLPEGSEGGYIYIPGTPVAVNVDGASDSTGTLLLDSLPACRLNAVVLARHGKPYLSRVLATDVLILSGSTTLLPFPDWHYSAPVRVSAVGVAGKRVVDIPLLLRLSAPRFDFSQAKGDGSDIRFAKEDGTPLPAHVQAWDSAGASATVWVRLDTAYADTGSHRLKMYWGNSRATVAQARAYGAVFDTASGYAGAWHLDGKPAGAPLQFGDAGNAGDRALAMGALASPDSAPAITKADGYLGAGAPLNGSDSWLKAGREYAGPAEFTLSLWFRTSSKQGGKLAGFVMPSLTNVTVASKPGNFNFDRVVWMTDDGLLRAGFTMRSSNYPTALGYWQSFTAAKAYNDGQWHQLAYTLWDGGATLMVDGAKVAGYTGLVRPLPIAGHWRVGYCGEGKWDPEWTSEFFQGSVDEVRIIHQSRSEDWLRLDYESERSGSAVLTQESP